ncbi:MAG: alpha/beta hydrolase [Saprospiraceae bacterium]|nr:alpha/beta hydrolase [Candidatus Opimibacter iunctus]
MKIKHKSAFKSPAEDLAWFADWVNQLELANGRKYESKVITTSLGKTQIWGLNTNDRSLEALVIFPGARTTSLFWDFDSGLDNLKHPMRIFMVETNGLPNPSDGNTPDIRSLDYGYWAAEVMDQLGLDKAYVAGGSFGGLICMKLAITNPEKIKAAFILNPGCLQPFSMKWDNLYYNLLPIISPKPANVLKFLDKAVFHKPNHQLSTFAEHMLVNYEMLAITRYKDNTQKPYFMGKQLADVKADTYLLEGDKDLLFPFQKSIDNARRYISTLVDVKVFEGVGHGIETYDAAIQYIGSVIHSRLKGHQHP